MPSVRFEDLPPDASFDLIDGETGNLVASFDSHEELREEFADVVRSAPGRADTLILRALDEKGIKLGSWLAHDVLLTA